MRFDAMERQNKSTRMGIPEVYADRPVLKAQDIGSAFTNDAPIIMVTKPKNSKDKETGKYTRVYTKDGRPMFGDVAYIPIMFDDGSKGIVVTASYETTSVLAALFVGAEPKVIRGEGDDAWTAVQASELIEGRLRFVKQPKRYANGRIFDIAVLTVAE